MQFQALNFRLCEFKALTGVKISNFASFYLKMVKVSLSLKVMGQV
jgi:hypothetical protein